MLQFSKYYFTKKRRMYILAPTAILAKSYKTSQINYTTKHPLNIPKDLGF